ncbi:ATP-binding cassette domain-containing protein [Streptomyces sp. NPDC048462]|uniref:ATP-binding cassette domain-containing protein n=1 Tax=Streptomyces sp. NPDC048462 TaxID=3365555 RepID=UPI00371357A6
MSATPAPAGAAGTTVLKDVRYAFERGTLRTILGPSGSGRTTLLSLASGLDSAMATRNVMSLSGGQQQRVATARALACDVDIVFADAPTGNLDEDTAQGVIDTFRDLAGEQDKRVVVVTHSQHLALQSDRIFDLRKGKLTELDSTR